MKRLLPAYPLWIIDPLFSVWSNTDALNDGDTVFWTGAKHRAVGLVRYKSETYCFMGKFNGVKKISQKDVSVTAFETEYRFSCEQFDMTVKFVSPRLLTDLKIMSCPVCYTEYSIEPKRGAIPEDLSVAILLDEDFCYNEKAEVVGGVMRLDNCEAAYFTRKRNLVLSDTSDMSAPDHGSTYITGEESFFITETAVREYITSGVMRYSRAANERAYIAGMNKSARGYFVTAFDDLVSVFYFGEWLKGYFFKDGATVIDAVDFAIEFHDEILEKCRAFDIALREDCEKVGDDYYLLCCAALRQSVGAHKLVQNKKGDLLFLSKECNSNGCIGTADVSYPSIPLYLLYNPELVNAMLVGIFDFARMPVWKYDFAPHDIGTYPWCTGQVYSLNRIDDKYNCGFIDPREPSKTNQMLYLYSANSEVYSMKDQMPVEECGNMLIMTAAGSIASGDTKLAEDNFDLLEKWVAYLERYGLKPDNQLCTDDFAGHSANNVNLAIKALVGIESFSLICKRLGKKALAAKYAQKAKSFASALKQIAGDGVLPLSYDRPNTYSLKYNILFDRIFGFELIGSETVEREINRYLVEQDIYGVPLDTRKHITKSDWLLWVVALTDDRDKRESLYKPIVKYLAETPSRVPFGDYYDNNILEGLPHNRFER